MRLFLLLLALPILAAEDEKKLTLEDGSTVRYTGEVALEWNMLALNTPRGKLMISKNLVNWQRTWYGSPDLVRRMQPEIAERMEVRGDSKAYRKPSKPVAITKESLASLKPGDGLTNEWKAEEGLAEAMAEIEAEKKGKPAKARSGSSSPSRSGSGPIIKTISRGNKVDIQDHMEPGRYVLFDFYADWCGPCRQLDPRLKAIVKKHPDKVALKKIDIKRWGTPVAKQYGVSSIPYVELYNSKGKKVKSGNGFEVIAHLEKLARKW